MQGPWDAPLEFRRQFADEDDPTAPDFTEPPVRWVAENEDPDLILGIQHAYAGQICLLDECLEALLDAFHAAQAGAETLLALASPRGYALGEHRRIGPIDPSIYGETLHVPCLIRYPDGADALVRNQQLVQPTDLFATLLQWFALPRAAGSNWGRSLTDLLHGHAHSDRAAAVSGTFRALRTPAWFLHADGNSKAELFAKPDDRWEANEVSDRCRDLLPELMALFDEFQQAATSSGISQLSEIPQFVASDAR
jgi:arylsulfatase A-like enzyme